MAYESGANSPLGFPVPGGVDTTAKVAVGSRASFQEDILGPGDFIYLPGAANVAAGDWVAYDLTPGAVVVTRATGLANSGRPVAVASAAILAGQYGWFQIGGLGIANCIAGTAAGNCYLSATTAQSGSVAVAGAQILGARTSSAVGTPAAGQCYVTLSFPTMQSAIT